MKRMMETDKLLVRIGTARDAISRKTEQTSLDYMIDGVLMNCSVLLKEQEAVEPIRDANSVRIFRCGACGEYVGFIDSDPEDPNEQDNYCRSCGRKVKWE